MDGKKELARRSSKQRVSENAVTKLGKYSGKYALSELLICDVCGSPYRRRTWTRNGVKKIYWRCLTHMEKGSDSCPQSKGIEESLLHEAICRALTKCIPDKDDVKKFVKTMLVYATSGDQTMLEYQSVENAIKEMHAKANEMELMCIRTEGNKELYLEQIKKYYTSIARMREKLNKLKSQLENSDTYKSELKQVEEWLSEEEVSFEEYDDSIVRYLVSSIRVTEDMNLIINIKGGGSIIEPLYCKKE